ncbi:MAG TPA: folylpolyglutamate synthase/dihydrofolate synthase family protein [Acidobacteriaceae bacterium]|jgi:dihydrofolate synthase/folylpolyglutamate synthase|nr:folylpolyglutamate synthase/dihydrofolate synthase family protein [Acidobacteriaceae bacterium]
MSYASALDGLHARAGELHGAPGQPRRKFRLEEMRTLVEALGHPEQRFRSILIAGTNGKGSTAATLSAILKGTSYRCGLYTSPHLERVNERIRIDGVPIGDEDFAQHYFRVDDCAHRLVTAGKLPGDPSFFEVLTAVAFEAFADAQVDLAVLEVGMGGRLDATNVVEPLLSIITDISLDHTEWLGETITLIAHEKAGILRRKGVLVTLSQHPEANQAIGEVAAELDVRGVNAAEYVPGVQRSPSGDWETSFRNQYAIQVMGETIEVDSPLAGVHQQRNIALAIAAAVELSSSHGFIITPAQIAEGILKTEWPGRLERMRISGKADVLLDVAHNPAGAWALRAALSSLEDAERRRGKRVLVFGCMKDKAYEEMARILFPLFDLIVTTRVESPRSATAEDLVAAAAKTGVLVTAARDGHEALERAFAEAPKDGLIVVAGSVYLVGEVRPLLDRVAMGAL